MKLILLEEILTVDQYAKFLTMLQKEWPQVYEACMKNAEAYKKFSINQK